MSDLDRLVAVVFLVTFLLGVRSTFRLWRRAARRDGERRAILTAFAVVSTTITFGAGFFGFFTIRRLLGYSALDWTPYLAVAVAAVILLLPQYLEVLVVSKIERGGAR